MIHNKNTKNIIPIIKSNMIRIISGQREQGIKGIEIMINVITKIVIVENEQTKKVIEIINSKAKLGYRIHHPNIQQAGAYKEIQIR